MIPTVHVCGQSKETSVTQVEISQARAALIMYGREHGRLPGETDNAMLVRIPEGDNPRKLKFHILDSKRSKTGQFIDGWGTPLLFKPNATGLLMRSAGKDGIYHTRGDLTLDVLEHKPDKPAPAGH